MHPQKPREIAFRVLLRREVEGGFVEPLLNAAAGGARLSPADRSLLLELVCGAVRWQETLDRLIGARTAGRPQTPPVRVLLRLGLYQLFWLDRVPAYAAISETVELVRRHGLGPQAGFVNAVLRAYDRERETTRRQLEGWKHSDPALGWSHPHWLVDRWIRRWGSQRTTGLLEWNNTPARTFARLNTLRADAGRVLEQWRAEDVEYDFGRWDWIPENLVFVLKTHPPLEHLPSFRQGCFYVQDPSTLLAVRLLDPQPGDRVLDACAAPGGKATFIAQLMRNEGRLRAEDTSNERLERLAANCARLGATCVEPHRVEPGAGTRPPGTAETFDRALVDVPCSNTGVIRRRADLRWRIRPAELERLALEQQALLAGAAQRVRPGGVLVYSTCSLEPEENRDQVQRFLAATPGFQLEQERELLPFVDGVDGAYVARLVRSDA